LEWAFPWTAPHIPRTGSPHIPDFFSAFVMVPSSLDTVTAHTLPLVVLVTPHITLPLHTYPSHPTPFYLFHVPFLDHSSPTDHALVKFVPSPPQVCTRRFGTLYMAQRDSQDILPPHLPRTAPTPHTCPLHCQIPTHIAPLPHLPPPAHVGTVPSPHPTPRQAPPLCHILTFLACLACMTSPPWCLLPQFAASFLTPPAHSYPVGCLVQPLQLVLPQVGHSTAVLTHLFSCMWLLQTGPPQFPHGAFWFSFGETVDRLRYLCYPHPHTPPPPPPHVADDRHSCPPPPLILVQRPLPFLTFIGWDNMYLMFNIPIASHPMSYDTHIDILQVASLPLGSPCLSTALDLPGHTPSDNPTPLAPDHYATLPHTVPHTGPFLILFLFQLPLLQPNYSVLPPAPHTLVDPVLVSGLAALPTLPTPSSLHSSRPCYIPGTFLPSYIQVCFPTYHSCTPHPFP